MRPRPSRNFAWFLGVLAGDGFVSKDLIGLSSVDREFTDKFARIGAKLFGVEPHYNLYKHDTENNWKDRHTIRFMGRNLALYLGDLSKRGGLTLS